VRVLSYLDDFLIACAPEDAAVVVSCVVKILTLLGWRISPKSNLKPRPVADFFGVDRERGAVYFGGAACED
jgi:hypothetical protein